MTHKYKGKEYEVQTGAKGGQFFIDDVGKKHYLKSTGGTPAKKKKSTEAIKKQEESTEFPKKYIGHYYIYDEDGEINDDFSEWTEANSYDEAEEYFKDEYRHNPKIELYLVTRE